MRPLLADYDYQGYYYMPCDDLDNLEVGVRYGGQTYPIAATDLDLGIYDSTRCVVGFISSSMTDLQGNALGILGAAFLKNVSGVSIERSYNLIFSPMADRCLLVLLFLLQRSTPCMTSKMSVSVSPVCQRRIPTISPRKPTTGLAMRTTTKMTTLEPVDCSASPPWVSFQSTWRCAVVADVHLTTASGLMVAITSLLVSQVL